MGKAVLHPQHLPLYLPISFVLQLPIFFFFSFLLVFIIVSLFTCSFLSCFFFCYSHLRSNVWWCRRKSCTKIGKATWSFLLKKMEASSKCLGPTKPQNPWRNKCKAVGLTKKFRTLGKKKQTYTFSRNMKPLELLYVYVQLKPPSSKPRTFLCTHVFSPVAVRTRAWWS